MSWIRGIEVDLGGILIGAMLVLAGLGAAAFWVRRCLERSQPGFSDARELFDELCQTHGLTSHQTLLLNRLAQSQRLAQPAMLFVEPERFEAERLASDLAKDAVDLSALRDKLFAESAAISAIST